MENNLSTLKENVDDLYSGKIETAPKPTSLGVSSDTPNPMLVKNKITGNSPKPLPSQIPPGSGKTFDFESWKAASNEQWDRTVRSHEDKNDWGTVTSYNSGPTGHFYDRYKDFTQPGKIEFHPDSQNNEAILNDNTNFLGDMYRTTTQALLPMIWNGVKGVYSSTAKIFNEGDFLGEDPQLAREYAYITAKNTSTKDNLGSFINNLTMNLGYTAGIMSTALFENWIGAGVSAFTGAKAATPKAANLLWKEYQAGKATDGIKSYTTMLEELKDINKVRQAWDKANGVGRIQKAVQSNLGKALNPFSNVTDNYYGIINNADDFSGYMQSGRNIVNTAGAAYRDFRNINLAVSESRLESGMVYNTLVNDLYNDFTTFNGRPPSDSDMEDIIMQAKQAAYETSFMNAGLIFLTNKVSFDNILNPRLGSQGFLKQRLLDWKNIGGGKFGELGKVVFDVGKNEWKFAEKGFKTWWNGWKTDPLHKSVWNSVGYFKRNLMEGTQESLQETISHANEKYYKDSFYSYPVRKNLISKAAFGKGTTPLSYYKEGLDEQFSKQGLATFASGFFMGSLAGGLNSTMSFLYEKANQIYDPQNYEVYKTEKSKIVNDLVDQMNAFGVEDMINSKLFNGGAQQILSTVQDSGNKKEVMDSESEALVQHIMTLNEYGVLDMYLNAIESYPSMTDAEFKDAFPKLAQEDVSKYKGRIGDVVSQARAIKQRIDKYDKLYPNPVDLSKYSKDDPYFEEAYIMHESWKWGVKSAVFYNEVFEDARKRMVEIMTKHYEVRPLQNMTKRQSDVILRPEEMRNEIGLLKNEANNLIAVGDAESKKLAKEKLKEAEALERYYEAYSEFSNYYHRDRYFNKAKSILQKEKGEAEEVTDEEVEQYLEDRFGPKNSEIEGDILLTLEKEYNNLLRSIANKPDDYLFTDTVDDAFELVLDFYKLNDESREMVDLINLMNDPNGFLSVYEKNSKWMTDLWLKRGDYYRDIVKEELSQIEDNGLLNYLANRGIFMEANDFILWRDQGIPPKEFYDEKKQLVIPEDSLAYDRYMQLLYDYAGLKEIESTAKEQIKKAELEIRIAELVDRKNKELEKLEAQFEENLEATTGETREQWEQKQAAPSTGRSKEEIQAEIAGLKSTLKSIEDTTEVQELLDLYETYAAQGIIPDNYTELSEEEMAKNNEAAVKFFKSTKNSGAPKEARQQATGIKITLPRIFNDKIAELEAEEPKSEEASVPPIQTTEAWKDYQKQIDKTNQRYNALIDKVKAQVESEEISMRPKEPEPVNKGGSKVNTAATWDELPEDLKAELQPAFDTFLTTPAPEGLGKPANLQKANPAQYEMLRNNWLEKQGDVIKEYNARPIDRESYIPKLKYATFEKPIEEYGLTVLRTVKDKLQSYINRNVDKNGNKLNGTDKAAIKNDIVELEKYIRYLRENYKPENKAHAVFRIFEEMVVNKQNGVSRILDEEGNTVGYQFPGKDGRPTRVTKLTESIENKITGKEPYLYDAVKETYVDEFGQTRGGQLLNMFRSTLDNEDVAVDKRLNEFMAQLELTTKNGKLPQLNSVRKLKKIKAALEESFTEEALIAVIKNVANDESTIAGNTLDDMSREAFKRNPEGGFMKPKKPAKMSDKAYDNIFGADGIITKLQEQVIDGRYEILSSDVIIYDEELLETGLVGAMDLLAFDIKTGDLMIIDIKTGKPKNWTDFNDDSKFNKKLAYRLQQSIYRALLFNMTGQLAKSVSILPIEIEVDMDGNITYAESAAKKVNAPLIRELKTQKLALEQADVVDQAKIKSIDAEIKQFEEAVTAPLEPVDDATLAKYGVIMKAPAIPDNLQTTKQDSQDQEPVLTEAEKKAQIKKLKRSLADVNKKIAGLKDGGILMLGDVVQMSPEYDKLNSKKTQIEAELEKLQGEPVPSDQDDDAKLKNEIDALNNVNLDDIFPSLVSISGEQFKKYIQNIQNSSTLPELNEAYNDAIIMIISEPNVIFGQLLEDAYKQRKLALDTDVSEENINVKDYLLSKKPIFGGTENQVVVVIKKTDGKITVQQVENIVNGKPKTKTFTDAKIKADFIKTTEEALKQEEEVMEPTPEEKENSTISKSSLKDFADNPELIDKAKQNAASLSKKDRLAALKKASNNNNINNCNS